MSTTRDAGGAESAPFGRGYGGSAPENYEHYFVPAIAAPMAASLVQHADLHRGERVLDVACGTGIVARLAAERVGPSGSVTGVDANPGMLHVAEEVVTPDTTVRWRQAAAETLPLPDEAVDVALCQMSLQFFDDRAAALHEMHRVLVPGGRVRLNVPGRISSFFRILADALARHVDPQVGGFVRRVFSMSDPGEHERLLREAGFREVTATASTDTLRLPPVREWLWQYIASTPLSEKVAALDDDRRAAIEREVTDRWAELGNGEVDEPMVLEQEIVEAAGRK